VSIEFSPDERRSFLNAFREKYLDQAINQLAREMRKEMKGHAIARVLADGYMRGHRGQRLVDFVLGRFSPRGKAFRRLVVDSARMACAINNQPAREGEE
jgi:hypothetical protein